MKYKRFFIFTVFLITVINIGTALGGSPDTVEGVVYWDKNNNGLRDSKEPGIPDVCVSNGREVVKTKENGSYSLPAYGEMIIFITKPSDFMTPVSENNTPEFFYIHQPNGSPYEIKRFPGIAPTGLLPESVDFPLLKDKLATNFNAVIIGDTQVYTHKEIEFLHKSIVKEASREDASLVIAMGDNVGNKLSLYPPYLSVMKQIGPPLYLVPGNHDMNFDTRDPKHAFETFKRILGPTYYSFNYGKVHFVVLNSVFYPSPLFNRKTYHGEIDATQMEWLKNDLKYVPRDHLIVLNMHIPLVSYSGRKSDKNKVINREALYDLLEGRNTVALGGHTHTLEHFLPGEEEKGWGQPTPIPQIIVGAACGSWWTGDLDKSGVPMSYQRYGAPKGFMLFKFNGNKYQDTYKASGYPVEKQMHLSFKTKSFDHWYKQLWDWLNENPNTRPAAPPVSLKDLPDPAKLTKEDLTTAKLVSNVWNGSRDSIVKCQFDGRKPIQAARDRDIGDPFALRRQAYVLRYSAGFKLWGNESYGPAPPQPLDAWLHTRSSTHTWTCDVPSDLKKGSHQVMVTAKDVHGNVYKETMFFEVVK